MTEKWTASLDQNGTCVALITDLLIAKLYAYGCHLPSLKLLNCYSRKRRQRVKIFIAHGQKFHLEYHKDLSLVPYFFTFFFAIYLSSSKIKT